jgi:cellulose synthase/poly-beta-1,6-N-acetylglucosamine synthase-like glycosyltransferase
VLVVALRIRADSDALDAWKQAHKDDEQPQKTVSIIIPVLNEETTLAGLFVHLRALDPQPSQVVFVDGGSTDRQGLCLICSGFCEACIDLFELPEKAKGECAGDKMHDRELMAFERCCSIANAAFADCSHRVWRREVGGCQPHLILTHAMRRRQSPHEVCE